jgi:hypothetical protein
MLRDDFIRVDLAERSTAQLGNGDFRNRQTFLFCAIAWTTACMLR